eukprot:11227934-Lingulodinium_polyedra.AAC.1
MIPGGILIARDGSAPLRIVLRLLADPDDHIWRRKKQGASVQLLFKPAGLRITHIFIYAVAPQYVRHCQLYQTRAIPQVDARAAR